MKTKIHRGSNYTTFSGAYANTECTVGLRRVFHPTRGEEVQLEIDIVRKTKPTNRYPNGQRFTSKASLDLRPEDAAVFALPLLGSFKAPQGPIHHGILQVYHPREYETMTDKEKRISMDAFEAGRQYSESLKPTPIGYVVRCLAMGAHKCIGYLFAQEDQATIFKHLHKDDDRMKPPVPVVTL